MTDTMFIGEKILCLYAYALKTTNLLEVSDKYEIETYDINNITIDDINTNQINPKICNYILTYEFGQVFKLSSISIESHIIKLVDIIKKINKYSTFTKHYRNYNTLINRIKQHLLNNTYDSYLELTVPDNILNNRDSIQKIQLYNKNGTRENKIIILNIPQLPINNYNLVTYKYSNFDNDKTNNKQIILKTTRMLKNNETIINGLRFGCDTKHEMFTMIASAVANATPNQLRIYYEFNRRYNNNNIANTINKIITHNTLDVYFTIDLYLLHGDKKGIINSDDIKILNVLSRQQVKEWETYNYSITNYYFLEYYIKYLHLVHNKIYQLIDSQYMDSSFDFISIKCFRPECEHINIYKKYKSDDNKTICCNKCKIAEFCHKCRNTDHVGECNIGVDSAFEEWINKNTKKCPNCNTNIEKNDGCNHMTCSQCHTHFCWLCNNILQENNITDHFIVNDDISDMHPAFNTICNGLIIHNELTRDDNNDI